MHRRQLLKRTLTATTSAAIASRAALPAEATGRERGVVIVRQGDAVVAVDPVSGKATPAAESATPAPRTTSASVVPLEPPAALQTDGEIDYWMRSEDGRAFVYRLVTDSGSSWWWLGEVRSQLPVLPQNLEPGFPSGSTARWFHGASVEAEHLGAGSLRLLAVDVSHGTVVLDEVFDRRLELAATTISDGGSLVAHLQGGNTRIDLWLADLRRRVRTEITVPIDPAAPVAPSEIDLEVAGGDNAVVAAGLAWSVPDHPQPFVVIVSTGASTDPIVTTIPGRLVGITPETI